MPNKSLSSSEIIFQALNRSNDLTVHDLALQCGIGEAAVRFHLRKMKETGLLLEFEIPSLGLRAGRKSHKYRLVAHENAGNLDNLCRALLKIIFGDLVPLDQQIPRLMAESVLGSDLPALKHGPSVLIQLTQWLNRHQYSARWEAGNKGPVIHFENCPYRVIRSGNEVLCHMDKEILNKATGLQWDQTSCINWEKLEGECVFVVKPSG
jgi:predicted ArsR family transcriptional regulator